MMENTRAETGSDYGWNDYDSWSWNNHGNEDAANYIGGTNEAHLTIGHVRQAKSLLQKQTYSTTWEENIRDNIME